MSKYAYAGGAPREVKEHGEVRYDISLLRMKLERAREQRKSLEEKLSKARAVNTKLKATVGKLELDNTARERTAFMAEAERHRKLAHLTYRYTPTECAQRLREASREWGGHK